MMINFRFFIGRHRQVRALRRRLAKVAMSSKPPGEAPTRQDVAWFQGFQASLLPSTARLLVLEPFSSEITFSGVRLKSTASRLTHSEWKSHRDLTDVGQRAEPAEPQHIEDSGPPWSLRRSLGANLAVVVAGGVKRGPKICDLARLLSLF